jgi:hypothetical protein
MVFGINAINSMRKVSWESVLRGPLAWVLQLLLLYACAERSCAHRGTLLMHLFCVFCLLIAAITTYLMSLTIWPFMTSTSEHLDSDTAPDRFLSQLGVLSNALFTLVILANWLVVMFLNPCPSTL